MGVQCVSSGLTLESDFESYFNHELSEKSLGHGIESVKSRFVYLTKKSPVKKPKLHKK